MRAKIKMYLQRIQKSKEKYKKIKENGDNIDYENQASQNNLESNKLVNDDFFIEE